MHKAASYRRIEADKSGSKKSPTYVNTSHKRLLKNSGMVDAVARSIVMKWWGKEGGGAGAWGAYCLSMKTPGATVCCAIFA